MAPREELLGPAHSMRAASLILWCVVDALAAGMRAEISYYYVVRRANEADAVRALRALQAFVRTPGGRVRLEGPDRVVVWRDGSDLYVSPGGYSLAGYLEPDPDLPRSPMLAGPEITPSRTYPGPAMVASGTIRAADLPASSVLVIGSP